MKILEEKRRKPVRLKDLAEMAKISVPAVSMALSDSPQISEKTKHLVKKLSNQMGYRINGQSHAETPSIKAESPSLTLGFAIIGNRLEDEWPQMTLHDLSDNIIDAGLRLEVAAINTREDTNLIAQRLKKFTKGLDGIFLSGWVPVETLMQIEKTNIPYVVLGYHLGAPQPHEIHNLHIVRSNCIAMGYKATQFLQKKHTRIAFIGGELYIGAQLYNQLSGYQLATLNAELELDPSLVNLLGRNSGRNEIESLARKILEMSNPPTGFFIPDIRLASLFFDVMSGLKEDISPDRVVLCGVAEYAELYQLHNFPLISEDHSGLAKLSVHILQSLCRNEQQQPAEHIVPFKVTNFL